MQYISPKRWCLSKDVNGVTAQKKNIRHLHHRENLKFTLCVDQQEIICMNLLHETSFTQLVSFVCPALVYLRGVAFTFVFLSSNRGRPNHRHTV
jgi:hypothetical protein